MFDFVPKTQFLLNVYNMKGLQLHHQIAKTQVLEFEAINLFLYLNLRVLLLFLLLSVKDL